MIKSLFGPSGLILLGAILSAIGALLASQQQTKFEQNISKKSEEIARLNREIANLVIGGESFCYMTIANIDNNMNIGILTFIHSGDHPLYSVNARIIDLDKFKIIEKNINFKNFRDADINIYLGDIAKGTALLSNEFPLGDSHRRIFNIIFNARNGFFNQKLMLKKIENQWVSALRVYREDRIIYERVDNDYPRSENGLIDWDEKQELNQDLK